MFFALLDLIFWGLAIAAFGMSVWALVHAIRTPARAFQAAGKLTKNLWLVFLGLATFFTLVAASTYLGVGFSQLNIFTIASVIASGIYLADVKPAVNDYRGGSNQGPYGPW
jgi:pilus assembly protein TadC